MSARWRLKLRLKWRAENLTASFLSSVYFFRLPITVATEMPIDARIFIDREVSDRFDKTGEAFLQETRCRAYKDAAPMSQTISSYHWGKIRVGRRAEW
jgi:hypothetical protein